MHLHVIMVPVELRVQRVLERVRRGGHAVPEQKIRDRYDRLWEHVSAAVRLADVAEVLDNGSARTPFRLCAEYVHGALIGVPDWPVWTPARCASRRSLAAVTSERDVARHRGVVEFRFNV